MSAVPAAQFDRAVTTQASGVLVSREACTRISHRCATALVSGTVALTLALSPSMAQAAAIDMPTTGMKLRTIMSLQDPDAPEDVAAPEGQPAGPVAEGPPIAAPVAAPPPAEPEPSKGLGLMIPGAIITGALGLPITTLGVIRLIQFNRIQQQTEDGLVVAAAGLGKVGSIVVITFGVLFLAAGVPMLAVGAHKFSRYQKWKKDGHALLPSMNRTAHGTWTGGLTLRF
jgi:hypothetical protein